MSRLHVSGQLPLQLLRRGIFRRGWVCWGKRNLINCRRRFFVRKGVCKVTLCTAVSTKAIVSATFFLFVRKRRAEKGCRSTRGVAGRRWGVANAATKVSVGYEDEDEDEDEGWYGLLVWLEDDEVSVVSREPLFPREFWWVGAVML